MECFSDGISWKQVYEPAIFTFWAKSAVDVEQRSIRLQSSSYTTSQILDTITAACVQVSWHSMFMFGCFFVKKSISSDGRVS